jgi:hypothetical protein
MIRMFVRHPVAAFATWKQAYDAFADERKGLGVVGDAVFKSTDDPNDVTVWHDFETIESANAFADSTRLHEVMSEAGVVGKPTIWFTAPV